MDRERVKAFAKRGVAVAKSLWGNGAQVIMKGVTYDAIVGEPRATGILLDAGEHEKSVLVIRIEKSVLPTMPIRDVTLTVVPSADITWAAGQKWKVIDVKDTRLDEAWTLHCESKN